MRITPSKPCCDGCVLEALTISGFDYSEPFVVYSNLSKMPARARREFVEQLIRNAHDAVLVVSTPVPAEFRREETKQEESNDDAAPTPEELTQILGAE